MKIFLFILTLFCTQFVYSQSVVDVYLKIVDKNKMPIKNMAVTLTDENEQDFKATTDETGEAFFLINRGMWYNVSIAEMSNVDRFEIPYRTKLEIKKTIVYNPNKMTPGYGPNHVNQNTKPTVDPKKTSSLPKNQMWTVGDTIYYNLPQRLMPIDTAALVQVEVVDENGHNLKNKLVKLQDSITKKIYAARTRFDGIAQFYVHLDHKFQIGIEEMDGIQVLESPKVWNMVMTINLVYTPTIIFQKVSNDTIYQQQTGKMKPTSGSVLVNILVHDLENKPLEKELVCLFNVKSKKNYAASTNTEGTVQFLLPKGAEYELSFKYARNIDLLKYEQGLYSHTTNIEYGYRGSKNIEHFYETAKRDDKKFLIEFGKSTAEKIGLDSKDSVIHYKHGFKLKFSRGSQVATPAIVGRSLFSDAGFYTSKFYCFDAITGEYKWGVNLQEGGISPAVVTNDYILVNTESCTLFVLDVKTGNLLWAKWLCPYLYTTPTVANNKIYVVYGNGIDQFKDKMGSQNYVLACFDLPTGAIEWQNWIDEEGLVTPVVAGSDVFLTTRSGTIYQFDKLKGNLIKKRSVGATTAPTIIGNKVYVSCVDKNLQTEHIEVFNKTDFKTIKSLTHLNGKIPSALKQNYACQLMNYQGSRTTHYKGLNYNVIGNKLHCSDLETGAINWTVDFTKDYRDTIHPAASFPVVCAGLISVATQAGKFNFYEPKTGKLIKSFQTDSEPWGQALLNKGVIYSGSKTGKLISFDTKDPLIDGIKQWGVSTGHNAVFE